MSYTARYILPELDGLLSAAAEGPWSRDDCERSLILVAAVPGRLRRVVETLAAQRSPAAVDALLRLAPQPGVVEGLFRALRHGLCRCTPDGRRFPASFALDFRASKASSFPALLARAHATFRGGCERLRVDGAACYRVQLRVSNPIGAALAGPRRDWSDGLGEDLAFLHRRLARLRGTRLWLNGWCFPQDARVRPPAQAHLLAAWIEWARARVAGLRERGRG